MPFRVAAVDGLRLTDAHIDVASRLVNAASRRFSSQSFTAEYVVDGVRYTLRGGGDITNVFVARAPERGFVTGDSYVRRLVFTTADGRGKADELDELFDQLAVPVHLLSASYITYAARKAVVRFAVLATLADAIRAQYSSEPEYVPDNVAPTRRGLADAALYYLVPRVLRAYADSIDPRGGAYAVPQDIVEAVSPTAVYSAIQRVLGAMAASGGSEAALAALFRGVLVDLSALVVDRLRACMTAAPLTRTLLAVFDSGAHLRFTATIEAAYVIEDLRDDLLVDGKFVTFRVRGFTPQPHGSAESVRPWGSYATCEWNGLGRVSDPPPAARRATPLEVDSLPVVSVARVKPHVKDASRVVAVACVAVGRDDGFLYEVPPLFVAYWRRTARRLAMLAPYSDAFVPLYAPVRVPTTAAASLQFNYMLAPYVVPLPTERRDGWKYTATIVRGSDMDPAHATARVVVDDASQAAVPPVVPVQFDTLYGDPQADVRATTFGRGATPTPRGAAVSLHAPVYIDGPHVAEPEAPLVWVSLPQGEFVSYGMFAYAFVGTTSVSLPVDVVDFSMSAGDASLLRADVTISAIRVRTRHGSVAPYVDVPQDPVDWEQDNEYSMRTSGSAVWRSGFAFEIEESSVYSRSTPVVSRFVSPLTGQEFAPVLQNSSAYNIPSFVRGVPLSIKYRRAGSFTGTHDITYAMRRAFRYVAGTYNSTSNNNIYLNLNVDASSSKSGSVRSQFGVWARTVHAAPRVYEMEFEDAGVGMEWRSASLLQSGGPARLGAEFGFMYEVDYDVSSSARTTLPSLHMDHTYDPDRLRLGYSYPLTGTARTIVRGFLSAPVATGRDDDTFSSVVLDLHPELAVLALPTGTVPVDVSGNLSGVVFYSYNLDKTSRSRSGALHFRFPEGVVSLCTLSGRDVDVDYFNDVNDRASLRVFSARDMLMPRFGLYPHLTVRIGQCPTNVYNLDAALAVDTIDALRPLLRGYDGPVEYAVGSDTYVARDVDTFLRAASGASEVHLRGAAVKRAVRESMNAYITLLVWPLFGLSQRRTFPVTADLSLTRDSRVIWTDTDIDDFINNIQRVRRSPVVRAEVVQLRAGAPYHVAPGDDVFLVCDESKLGKDYRKWYRYSDITNPCDCCYLGAEGELRTKGAGLVPVTVLYTPPIIDRPVQRAYPSTIFDPFGVIYG